MERRSALLRWIPAQEALAHGRPIYEVGEECCPTLPVTLLPVRTFLAPGPVAVARRSCYRSRSLAARVNARRRAWNSSGASR